MMPLNPLLQQVLHINNKQFSILVSSYAASSGIFGFIGSFFIDKYDRKPALLFLYSGFILGTIGCAIAKDYYFFLVSRIIAGAFGGIMGALVLAIIGDVIDEKKRGRATGIVMAAFSAASVLGIPAGFYLAVKLDWHMPFILIAGLSVAVLIAGFKVLPSVSGHLDNKLKKEEYKLLKEVTVNANMQKALLFTCILMIAGLTVIPFISDFMVKNVGLQQEEISLIYLFGGIATVFTGPAIGRYADKYGKVRMFVIIAAISIIPILLITNMPFQSRVFVFSVTTIFFIFFGGRFVPATAMVTSCVERNKRGGFMSINAAVQQLASAFSSFLAGMIVYTTADGKLGGFWILGLIATCATLICIWLAGKIKMLS